MAAKSPIEWTDASWTPLRGRVKQNAAAIAQAKGYTSLVQIAAKMAGHVGPHCEKVSPECEKCYSETTNKRCLPVNGTGLPFDRRSRDLVDAFMDENILTQPMHWRKPRKIFVCSQTDLFGDWVTDDIIDRVFAVMAMCPQHTFQVLTKRAKRMREYLADEDRRGSVEDAGGSIEGACYASTQAGWPLPNVWLGVSAGTQKAADERIPELLRTPAAVRFVSAEPLLEEVSFRWAKWVPMPEPGGTISHLDGLRGIDWVICGGESGHGARPMHPMWARSLRDQCSGAGVPFFFKQWGNWGQDETIRHIQHAQHANKVIVMETAHSTDRKSVGKQTAWCYPADSAGEFGPVERLAPIGKHRAGRLLDGIEHNALPAYWAANVGLVKANREDAKNELAVIG